MRVRSTLLAYAIDELDAGAHEGDELVPTREQRCWFHKLGNVLDKLPKSVQPKAKGALYEVMNAPTKKVALKAIKAFSDDSKAKDPKADECLAKDQVALLSFLPKAPSPTASTGACIPRSRRSRRRVVTGTRAPSTACAEAPAVFGHGQGSDVA